MYNGQYQTFKQWQAQQFIYAAKNAGYMSYNRSNTQGAYGGSAERVYGTFSSPARRSNQNPSDYNPDPLLPAYSGPYPEHELQRARMSLINSLQNDTSEILQQIKPRLGISSIYGVAHKLLPTTPNLEDSTSAIVDLPNSLMASRASATVTSSSSPPHGGGGSEEMASPTSGNRNSPDSSGGSSNASSQKIYSLKRKSNTKAYDNETPIKKVHSDSKAEVATAQQIFKCDFCNYQGSTKSVIEFHLSSAKHFSASLYTTQGSKLVAVEKKLAVKQESVKNEALVVVCPTCHDLFEDIFMCGMHYKYAHGGASNNGFYAITPVIHTQNVVVHQKPLCQKCSTVFDKQRTLHKHWVDNPNHHPLTKPLPEQAFAIYACLYCNKTFMGDFLSCKCHVLGHRDSTGQERAVCAAKVTHIMKPGRGEELLPLSETSFLDGLEDEVETLKNMVAHFNGMSGTKSKVEMCQKRIKYLQQFRQNKLSNDEKFRHKKHTNKCLYRKCVSSSRSKVV